MTGQLAGPVRLRWPLAMTAIMVGVLVSLGFWQLDRLSWKQQLIDRIEESLAKPARPLPAEDPSLSVLEYRRVVFKGTFTNKRAVRLFALNHRGEPGYHIYAQFRLENGRRLIVNRGWVPKALGDNDADAYHADTTPVELTGRIRLSGAKGWFSPPNDLEDNIWYFADLNAMAGFLSVSDPLPIFVELDDNETEAWPRGGVTRLEIPNNHLPYAITWFALAIVLIVIFGLWEFRRRRDLD